jgi:hypothetical protein
VTTRRLLYGALGLLGFGLYLWPAIAAPVVLWSDSQLDLKWAREGVGIVSPAPTEGIVHPAKPFYILFLKAVELVAPPGAEARWSVILQSILVWLAIAVSSMLVARKISRARGVALYVVLILTLRLRDSASAVMSEALSSALFLVLCAALINPGAQAGLAALLGLCAGALFLVRPNVGAIAAILALVAWLPKGPKRAPLVFLAAFAVLALPIWIATAPPRDAWRGLSPAFTAAAAEYGWLPAANHRIAESTSDARRQLVWRTFHGVFGTEYYDARFSPRYRALSEASRLFVPWLVIAAIAALAVAPRAPGPARRLGLTLCAVLVVQSFVLGALPRFSMPMIPGLFLFAAASWPPAVPNGRRVWIAAAAGVAIAASLATQPEIFDWEWGKVETAGIRIDERVPRGALPDHAPATLHLRIAAPVLPSAAGLVIRDSDGRALFDTDHAPFDPAWPDIAISLPESILAANRGGPVMLTLESRGSYDSTHFLLFPVVPPPWKSSARREGSGELSPESGVSRGSLDWWAHPGVDR